MGSAVTYGKCPYLGFAWRNTNNTVEIQTLGHTEQRYTLYCSENKARVGFVLSPQIRMLNTICKRVSTITATDKYFIF